jgi:Na+-transporting methylmalonyl-CoA/oxaloacetate decarboxylase gamma subunit
MTDIVLGAAVVLVLMFVIVMALWDLGAGIARVTRARPPRPAVVAAAQRGLRATARETE